MDNWGLARNTEAEPKKADWFDRGAKTVLVVVAVLGLTQEKATWFPYVLVTTIVMLNLPLISQQWKKWKVRSKQNRALSSYTNDFISFVNRAQDFVQSTNQYGIAYFLRNIVTKQGMDVKRFSPHLESFFSQVLRNLQTRAKAGFRSYAEFEQVSDEFRDAMNSFVLIFADDILRELKQSKNLAALNPNEISGLKQRYGAFSGFINEYNGFRAKLSVFWGEEDSSHQIVIPTETID